MGVGSPGPGLMLGLEKPSALTPLAASTGQAGLRHQQQGRGCVGVRLHLSICLAEHEQLHQRVYKEDGGGCGARAELSADASERAASWHCLTDGAALLPAVRGASLFIPGAAPGPSRVSEGGRRPAQVL